MRTDTVEMNHAERVEWLAEREAQCPCNGNVGNCGGICRVCVSKECCGAMGQVPTFPMLRGPCPGERGFPYIQWHHRAEMDNNYIAQCCQGRGWVPVTTTDALLEAGRPYGISLVWNKEKQLWAAWYHSSEENFRDPVKEEALSLALVAAVRQEVTP